jgi:TonB family protein
MKKLSFMVWICFGIVTLQQLAGAQEARSRQRAAANATTSDKEQDGLNGPVRRVRVETAKIVVKDGKSIEASRVVRGVTTYDIQGQRIDTVAHPVEGSAPSGREQYRYDNKGNIIEMLARGDDGSVLSKEVYSYEFDELGNWKKMTTSLVLYEDGKLTSEPVEVTYRKITYYYSQGVDKIANTSAVKGDANSARSPSPVPTAKVNSSQMTETITAPQSKPATNPTLPAVGRGGQKIENSTVLSAVSTVNERTDSVKTSSSKSAEPPPAPAETPSVPADTTPLVYVSEDVLRSAAINLPRPEFPLAAELTGQKGRVEVQVIIDEKGQVTAAKGTSSNQHLNEAAEAAALKARFSPSKLSSDRARVFGVIAYDFGATSQVIPAGVASGGAKNETAKSAPPKRVEPPKNSDNATASSETSNTRSVTPNVPAPADSSDLYKQGLSYLKAGQFAEAVSALRQAVTHNPEDAVAYAKLGLAYSALGQYTEAIAALKMAILIKPQLVDAEAYYRLGEAYSAVGKQSDAVKALKQALSIIRAQESEKDSGKYNGFPTLAELHFGLGVAYSNSGLYKDALKELKQAIDLNPQFAEAHFGIALAYIGLGERKEAEKEEKLLRRLNATLADKVAALINSSVATPPGYTGTRRRP